MNAEIEQFCEKHVITPKVTNDILLIIEELIVLYQAQASGMDVHLRVSYSEKEKTIKIEFDAAGIEGNMLEKAAEDDIGVMIIRKKTEKVEHHKEGNRSKLSMYLKTS
jgi:hypothetical protein